MQACRPGPRRPTPHADECRDQGGHDAEDHAGTDLGVGPGCPPAGRSAQPPPGFPSRPSPGTGPPGRCPLGEALVVTRATGAEPSSRGWWRGRVRGRRDRRRAAERRWVCRRGRPGGSRGLGLDRLGRPDPGPVVVAPGTVEVWSASVVWPCSSSTTMAVRGSAAPARSPAARGRRPARWRTAGRVLRHRQRQQPLEGDRHIGAAGRRHGRRTDPGHEGVGRVVAAGHLERRPTPRAAATGWRPGSTRRPWRHRWLPEEHLRRGPRHGHAHVVVLVMGGATAGDAEVGEARRAVLADQHVGGLDVAVDDAGPVGGLDRAGQLDARAQDLLDGEPLRAAHASRGSAAGSTS